MGSSTQGILIFAVVVGTSATVWRWRFLSRSYRAGMILLGFLCLLFLIEDKLAAGRYFATLPAAVGYVVQFLPTVLILLGLFLLSKGRGVPCPPSACGACRCSASSNGR